MNEYCMFKGELINAAPFLQTYVGSPHYVINVKGADQAIFKIVVNSASVGLPPAPPLPLAPYLPAVAPSPKPRH